MLLNKPNYEISKKKKKKKKKKERNIWYINERERGVETDKEI